MIWLIVCVTAVSVVALFVLFVLVVLFIATIPDRKSVNLTEEKGPMPKNHGGFGQRVTGGKS